jgi:hypothetical protein
MQECPGSRQFVVQQELFTDIYPCELQKLQIPGWNKPYFRKEYSPKSGQYYRRTCHLWQRLPMP